MQFLKSRIKLHISFDKATQGIDEWNKKLTVTRKVPKRSNIKHENANTKMDNDTCLVTE